MTMASPSFIESLGKLGSHFVEGQTLTLQPPMEITDVGEARRWLDALCARGATGWAQFSDVNLWIENCQFASPADGILLAAELRVEADDTAHHLRYNGEHWIAVEISKSNKAEAYLETHKLLHKDEKSKLTYQVAWERDASQGEGLRPVAFRFVRKA